MRTNWVALSAALAFAAAAKAQETPAPNIAGETLADAARRAGYTEKEFKEYFPPIETWGALGVRPAPEKPANGFACGRFNPPPPPHTHPRVYFNPEDLPAIRLRLKEDALARAQMELVRGYLLALSPRKEDWERIPYGQNDFARVFPEYLAKGIRVNRRMGYHGPWLGGWMDDLAAGRDPEGLAGKWGKPAAESKRNYLMHLLPFEALRCLVDDDKEGGARVAAALTGICKALGRHMDMHGPSQTDWQSMYQFISSDAIGVTYDWAYNFMSDEQRHAVRSFIADVTRGKTFLGLNQAPAFPANTTNWIIMHMHLLPMVLSIEGEEGYDPMVYERCKEGMRKWVYVACGPEGAPFEGFNKSTYCPQWLIPLAKRGANFLGAEWCKNNARLFQLNVMLPNGEAHVFGTGFGTARDMSAFKYAYPDDPVIDIVYALGAKGQLDKGASLEWPNVRTTYAPWWPYLVIDEKPLGASPDGSYDYAAQFDKTMARLRADGEPTSYYSDYRGLMTARTAWERNAAFLLFEPRNIPGGHTWDSRNDFVVASHGRAWGARPPATEGPSSRRSVILIDGKGQGHQCPQGRTVAFADTPEATFCVGDAAWAYSHAAGRDSDALVMFTPNDSRITPSPLPWMGIPWSSLPSWHKGEKGGDRHGHWRTHNPVQRAFRCAGLVKGKHPYILLLDDYRKDDKPHLYEWQMQLQNDVRLVRSERNLDGTFDLILGEDGPRRLLIRVLAAGDTPSVPDDLALGARLDEYEVNDRGNVSRHKRLLLPAQAAEGHFEILIYPFAEGGLLPKTARGQDALKVSFDGQEDDFAFDKDKDGRSVLSMRRNQKNVLRLGKPTAVAEPLPPP